MPTEIDQPQHSARWLVEFTWNQTNTLKVTDWQTQVTHVDLGTFSPLPDMEIRVPTNTGEINEQPLEIRVIRDGDALFQDLTTGEPHAPVTVEVYEEMWDDTTANTPITMKHFSGRIVRAYRNFQGRSQLVKLEAVSIKSRLDVPMGLPCNPQCVWALFDNNCQVPSIFYLGTLAAVGSGNTATVTGLAAQTGRYFERGYLERNGLRIGIREWQDTAATTFYLRQRVPADWVGQTVNVFPGCDKTIETCRSRWSNEQRFGGFGYAIPDYQPNYEAPA